MRCLGFRGYTLAYTRMIQLRDAKFESHRLSMVLLQSMSSFPQDRLILYMQLIMAHQVMPEK